MECGSGRGCQLGDGRGRVWVERGDDLHLLVMSGVGCFEGREDCAIVGAKRYRLAG